MRRTEQDNTHCFKHACTHKRDVKCPYCEMAQLTVKLWRESHPDSNRVKHPDAWREMDGNK
jgi:hypothetical protein